MTTNNQSSISTGRLWAGGIITGLVVIFLVFDGVTKILQVTPVVEASKQVGLAPQPLLGIGILLVVCTAIYAIPKTAVLGVILLTGYLGGAAAIHVRAGSGAFPVAFAIAFGVVAWAGLVLREPWLLGLLLNARDQKSYVNEEQT